VLQILLQDKYNIGVLTVNIEFMWLGTKRMENLSKARLSPVSKPRHINSIFTVNKPILKFSKKNMLFNLIIKKKIKETPLIPQ
jgi:hypothetical protein